MGLNFEKYNTFFYLKSKAELGYSYFSLLANAKGYSVAGSEQAYSVDIHYTTPPTAQPYELNSYMLYRR